MKKKSLRKIGKKAACIALCILLGSVLTGCTIGGGEPYVMTVDGTQIIPGTTTVQNLADVGYELSDFTGQTWVTGEDGNKYLAYVYVYDLTADAEAMTVYSSIVLLKDGEEIAMLSIVNDKQSEIPIAECKIESVTVHNDDLGYETASVEGVAFTDMSAETLKEALGKPDTDTDSKTEWERGDYSLTIEYEDGQVKRVNSSYPGVY